jgi:3-oxoacyl-[acyl-carrier protein] reductase
MPKMLITGASRGLGANIAKKFSSSYDLILQYNTSETEARALQEELVAQGAKVQLVQADLSTEEGVYVVADKILSEETPLDVLINNAGIWQEGMALDNLDWQNMQEIFIVNVFAAAKLTSLCLEKMPKDVNSNVIFFTSVATQLNIPDIAAYTAAKSAVESFMACFAKGEAPIRFNAIAPGVVPTGIHRHRFQDNVKWLH